MSLGPESIVTGNPLGAVVAGIIRALGSNSVGFGPGGPLRAFFERVVAAGQPPPPPSSSLSSSAGTLGRVWDQPPTITNTAAPPVLIVSGAPAPKIPTPGPRRRFPRRRRPPVRTPRRTVPRRPLPRVPLPRVPSPDVPGTRIPRVLPRILRPLGLPFLIFWPSTIGKEAPVRVDEIPRSPRPAPTGPPRRPVVRPPQPIPLPGQSPDTVTRPAPGQPSPEQVRRPQPRPEPPPVRVPVLDPTQLPRPQPIPTPTPSPRTWPRPLTVALPFALPFVLPLLSPSPRPAPSPIAAPGSKPVFGPTPLTPLQPLGVSSPASEPDRCRCPKPERRRRDRQCRNKIVSSRKYTRGGRRYRTITRRLECPASSRGKPQLRQVL